MATVLDRRTPITGSSMAGRSRVDIRGGSNNTMAAVVVVVAEDRVRIK